MTYSYSRLLELRVERLEHCPPEQLRKATGGSIGYDLKVADTIVIPTIETLKKRGDFSWVPKVKLKELTEGQQRDVLESVTTSPFGRPVLSEDGKVLVEKDTTKSLDPSYSFYIDSNEVVHVKSYNPFLVRTGIKISTSDRCWMMLAIRSGLAVKQHINLINGIGVVDADYPQEYLLALQAIGDDQIVNAGERVAQMIISPFIPAEVNWGLQDDIMYVDPHEYGGVISPIRTGGFGSTGV